MIIFQRRYRIQVQINQVKLHDIILRLNNLFVYFTILFHKQKYEMAQSMEHFWWSLYGFSAELTPISKASSEAFWLMYSIRLKHKQNLKTGIPAEWITVCTLVATNVCGPACK